LLTLIVPPDSIVRFVAVMFRLYTCVATLPVWVSVPATVKLVTFVFVVASIAVVPESTSKYVISNLFPEGARRPALIFMFVAVRLLFVPVVRFAEDMLMFVTVRFFSASSITAAELVILRLSRFAMVMFVLSAGATVFRLSRVKSPLFWLSAFRNMVPAPPCSGDPPVPPFVPPSALILPGGKCACGVVDCDAASCSSSSVSGIDSSVSAGCFYGACSCYGVCYYVD